MGVIIAVPWLVIVVTRGCRRYWPSSLTATADCRYRSDCRQRVNSVGSFASNIPAAEHGTIDDYPPPSVRQSTRPTPFDSFGRREWTVINNKNEGLWADTQTCVACALVITKVVYVKIGKMLYRLFCIFKYPDNDEIWTDFHFPTLCCSA